MDLNEWSPIAPVSPAVSSAVLRQESNGNPDSPTSVDGAVGQAQITPDTFKQYALPGEKIDSAVDNLAVHNRIMADLNQKAAGDPARIAVGYFSGPGNIAPPDSPTPWKADHKDGNGKSVSGYVSDVLGRLPQNTQESPDLSEWSAAADPAQNGSVSIGTPANPVTPDTAPFSQMNPIGIANNALHGALDIRKTLQDIPSQMLGGANDLADLVTNNTGDDLDKAKADFNQKYQAGTATSSDYKKLYLQGFADNPGGKFLGATRLFPPFAAAASAFQNVINPELESLAVKAGADPEDIPIAEQALMLKGAGELGDKTITPEFINRPVRKATAALQDFAGKPISDNPNLPIGMDKMPDSGKPLLVSNSGVREGMNAFNEFQKTDGIDLNKAADTLEEMQKTNPDARAIDAMTKTEGDIPTGANIQGLAKSIASSPGQGRTMIAEMSGRGQQAADRIGNAFDQTISNLPYAKVKSDAIQAKEGTGPLYQQAFQANQNMNSPKINQILSRPAGKMALNNAATTMQNDGALVGVSNPDLVEQAALTGQPSTGVGIADGLKMRTLHYAKQELWDLAQKERDPKTMQYSANGRAILGQYNDLVSEMNANDATRQPNEPNSGLYAQANQKYSTGARQQSALEQGVNFHQMRPDDIKNYLNDKAISDPEKAAFLSGVRERLQTVADRKNPGQNPINSLGKIDMLKRYQAIAGNNAPKLLAGMGNEAHMAKNDNYLAGSQTYSNEAFSKSPATPHTLAARMVGEVPIVGGAAGYFIDKALAKQTAKMSADSKAVVARILTSRNPAELRALANKQGLQGK